jgi:hypothetical protein
MLIQMFNHLLIVRQYGGYLYNIDIKILNFLFTLISQFCIQKLLKGHYVC